MQDCGDKIDKSTFVLMNILGLPFIPICILNFAAGGGVDINGLLSTCIPFILGMILGYLDLDIKEFSKYGVKFLLPFMGFCLGAGIDLKIAAHFWYHGILLYLAYMVLNWPILLWVDRKILRQRGHSSTAICCVAGLSLTVPALMEGVSSNNAINTAISVAQLSFVVFISVVITPVLVHIVTKAKTE